MVGWCACKVMNPARAWAESSDIVRHGWRQAEKTIFTIQHVVIWTIDAPRCVRQLYRGEDLPWLKIDESMK